MEPGNFTRERICRWLNGGSGFDTGRSDNGLPQDEYACARRRQFHGRDCSPGDQRQSVKSGQLSNPLTGHPCKHHSHRTAKVPTSTKLAEHAPQESPPVILHYHSSTWKKLYGFCRLRRTHLIEKFNEQQVKDAMIRALQKQIVSIDEVNSFRDTTKLSESQELVIDRIFAECFCKTDSATPVTSGLQKTAGSKQDVIPSAPGISKEPSAPIASSHTREIPLRKPKMPPKMPPTLQRARQIELADHKSSVLPELKEPSELHLILESLGISPGNIKKIIDRKLYELEAPALYHTLTYEFSLEDNTALSIVRYLKPEQEVARMIQTKNEQLAVDQAEGEFWLLKRQQQKQLEDFNYANDLELALKLSARDISAPQFTTLVFGSRIDSATSSRFDLETTAFADIDHADLCGNIHDFADHVPVGKKFKEILIKGVPEMEFDDLEKTRILFNKIYNLLEDHGKLSISFGTSLSGYNNGKFFSKILDPAGFTCYQSSTKYSSGRNGVKMDAFKVVPQQRGPSELHEPLRQVVSSGAWGVAPSMRSQAAGSNSSPSWVEYSVNQKALVSMLQGTKEIDREIIELALNDPNNSENKLTMDEFAHLQVRYNEYQQMREKPEKLPGIEQIHNATTLLQEARQLYQAAFGQGEESYSSDTVSGTIPVAEQPADHAGLPEPYPQLNSASELQIDNVIKALREISPKLQTSDIRKYFRSLELKEYDIRFAAAGSLTALEKVYYQYQVLVSGYQDLS